MPKRKWTQLGSRLTIIKWNSRPEITKNEQFLLAWSTDNPAQVDSVISMLMRKDSNARQAKIGATPIWKIMDDDRESGAVSVAHGHLLISSHVELLEKVLEDK